MKKTLPFLTLLMLPAFAHGAVTFVGNAGSNGPLDFDAASGNRTQSGLTVTLTASVGKINATSEGLGINGPASGDATDGLDTTNGAESLSISFDQDVIFNSIEFAGFSGDDAVDFTLGGGSTTTYTSSGNNTINTKLNVGEAITITAADTDTTNTTANNGVQIINFSAAVPEPSTVLLGALAFLGLLRRRR